MTPETPDAQRHSATPLVRLERVQDRQPVIQVFTTESGHTIVGQPEMRAKIEAVIREGRDPSKPLGWEFKHSPRTLHYRASRGGNLVTTQRVPDIVWIAIQMEVEGALSDGSADVRLSTMRILGQKTADGSVDLPPLEKSTSAADAIAGGTSADAARRQLVAMQERASALRRKQADSVSTDAKPTIDAFVQKPADPNVEAAFAALLGHQAAVEAHEFGEGKRKKPGAAMLLKKVIDEHAEEGEPPPSVQVIAKALSLHHGNAALRIGTMAFLEDIAAGTVPSPLRKRARVCQTLAGQMLDCCEEIATEETGVAHGKAMSLEEGLKKLDQPATQQNRTNRRAGFDMLRDVIRRSAMRPPPHEQGPEGAKRAAAYDSTVMRAAELLRTCDFFDVLPKPDRDQLTVTIGEVTDRVARRGNVQVDRRWMDQSEKRKQRR